MAVLVNKFILTNTGDMESPYVMAVRTVDLVSLSPAEVLLFSCSPPRVLSLVLHHFRDTYTMK